MMTHPIFWIAGLFVLLMQKKSSPTTVAGGVAPVAIRPNPTVAAAQAALLAQQKAAQQAAAVAAQQAAQQRGGGGGGPVAGGGGGSVAPSGYGGIPPSSTLGSILSNLGWAPTQIATPSLDTLTQTIAPVALPDPNSAPMGASYDPGPVPIDTIPLDLSSIMVSDPTLSDPTTSVDFTQVDTSAGAAWDSTSYGNQVPLIDTSSSLDNTYIDPSTIDSSGFNQADYSSTAGDYSGYGP